MATIKSIITHPTEAKDLNSEARLRFLEKLATAEEIEEIRSSQEPIKLYPPLWDRQLGENDTDYVQFVIFANLAPGQRSMKAAWNKWSGQEKKHISGAFKWKHRHYRWAERADAWDLERITHMRDNWLTRDEARREADFRIGDLLREIATLRIAEMSQEEIKKDVSPHTAARFVELASKLQENAMPDIQLEATEIRALLDILPETKRENIVALLISERKMKLG